MSLGDLPSGVEHTHIRPTLDSLATFRYGGHVHPKAFALATNIEHVVAKPDASYRAIVELIATRPTFRYVVFEYEGPDTKHLKTLINKLRVIVDGSSLFEGQGGPITPVLSVLPTPERTLVMGEGWIVADNIYETAIISPGWVRGACVRSLPEASPGPRYVILRGYLGDGIGSYPREWLAGLARQLASSQRAVIDWRLTTLVSTPLPAISIGGFVLQPILASETDPNEPSSVSDARVFNDFCG